MLDVLVFNVELGQSIFFYPRNHPEYGMFVDCGNTPEFDPIDFLLPKNFIHYDEIRFVLGSLTLTNYDHDHYSGLPYLLEKVHISTIRFPFNLTAREIYDLKPDKTEALEKVCVLRGTYTLDVPDHVPPYSVARFHLDKSDFFGQEVNTNNLSQVVFVEYLGSTICISGDLEKAGWEIMLKKRAVQEWLGKTNILIAAHHGRENGYAEEVFTYCWPECIIISDKRMMHGTQEGMSQTYANHVLGNGIVFNEDWQGRRKVLTTRSDGHLWVRIDNNGSRIYRSFVV